MTYQTPVRLILRVCGNRLARVFERRGLRVLFAAKEASAIHRYVAHAWPISIHTIYVRKSIGGLPVLKTKFCWPDWRFGEDHSRAWTMNLIMSPLPDCTLQMRR